MKRSHYQKIYAATVVLGIFVLSATFGFAQEPLKGYAIIPEDCRTCQTESLIKRLKSYFPGIDIQKLTTDDPLAKEMIAQLFLEVMPAFVLPKDIDAQKNFSQLRRMFHPADDHYYLQPSYGGVSYFLNREKKPGQLDLFILLTQDGAQHALKLADDIRRAKDNPLAVQLHFMGKEDLEIGQFISPGKAREIQEGTLAACIEEKYPAKIWDYLLCRVQDTDNLWWSQCLEGEGLDIATVANCAQSKEGEGLFRNKIRLSQEMQVFYGPFFLLDNKEIFGITSKTVPGDVLDLFGSKKKESANP